MRRVILLVGLAFVVALFFVGSAASAVRGSDLPFMTTQSGTSTLNAQGQGTGISTGTASHFGLVTFDQQLQLVPTGVTGTFDWFGTWTMTAANGDEISGTSSGSGTFTDPVHATWVVTYTSTAGTGRFADASLTFVGTAHTTRTSAPGVNPSTGVFDATGVGLLSY
ncbi:MAG TPA: hypothetical protein VFJ79_02685 [Acidimicrobiales bacterium]|nr:hypothetical protein [Acidimicrobiales bacterium]